MNDHSPVVLSSLGPSSQGGKRGDCDSSSEVKEQASELGTVAGASPLVPSEFEESLSTARGVV